MDYVTRISVKTNKERKRGSLRNLLLILSVEACYIAIFLAMLTRSLHAIFFDPATQLG